MATSPTSPLNDRDIQELDAAAEPGTATVVGQDAGGYCIRTSCKAPQLLVVSERYWPEWRIGLDHQPGPELLRVYGDFMGCVVPAGTHVVQFRFIPGSLRLGVMISLIALGLCLGGLAVLLCCRSAGPLQRAVPSDAVSESRNAETPADAAGKDTGAAPPPSCTEESPEAPPNAHRCLPRNSVLGAACLALLVLLTVVAGTVPGSSTANLAGQCLHNLHLSYALASGELMEAAGGMTGAEAAYRDALRCDPGQTSVQIRLGAVLIARGKADEGLRLINGAASPGAPNAGEAAEACAAAAKRCMAAGSARDAVSALRCALSLTPHVLGYRAELAKSLEAAGDRDAALAEYRTVITEAPESPKSAARIDAILEARGEASARVEEWRQTVSSHPGTAVPQLHLGLALEASGDISGAREPLEKALRINPDLTEARSALDRLDAGKGSARH